MASRPAPRTLEHCPITLALQVVDRWALLIVRDLLAGPMGFNELSRSIPGISRSVLAVRLRHLTAMGVTARTVKGSGHGYVLTSAGLALQPVLRELGRWSIDWAIEQNPAADLLRLLQDVSESVLPDPVRKPSTVQVRLGGGAEPAGWLRLNASGATYCIARRGEPADLTIVSDVGTLRGVWSGSQSWARAVATGALSVAGADAHAHIRIGPAWFRERSDPRNPSVMCPS